MRRWILPLSVVTLACLGVVPASASSVGFATVFLASDQPGVAISTDPGLVNAWGMAASGTSPIWIGVNGSGTSELYNGLGQKQSLVVSIPGDGSVTGVVFSNVVGSFNGDTFLFDSEDGTISGWRGALGTTAETLVPGSAANVYKGLAEGTVGGNVYAYAANFRNGTIDVLKGNGASPNLPGTFTDPTLPAGYAPFDVQNIGNTLYVTYAVQDATKHDDEPGLGNGIVDTFNLDGTFGKRLVTGGVLDSPWGLAIAPTGFGTLGGDLLVGNFGDGLIHAFDPTTGALVSTLSDIFTGNPIMIDGLWALRFGNGGNAGQGLTTLFFTAGPDGESHGLFGDITSVPEPATCVLLGSGLIGLVARRRRASHAANVR